MFENERKPEYPMYDDDCKAIIEKFLTICLPVTTTPCVKVGKIKTECCGNPIISSRKHENCYDEMKEGSCKFTIIQKMKIEIPIDFDAHTKIDDFFVDCEFRPDRYEKDDKHDKYDRCDRCDKYDRYDKDDKDDKDDKHDKYDRYDKEDKDDKHDKYEKDYKEEDKKDKDDKHDKCEKDDKHDKCEKEYKDYKEEDKKDKEHKEEYKKYC